MQLIFLQNANGSWTLNERLASILGMKLEDIKAAHPDEVRFKEQRCTYIFDGTKFVMAIWMNRGPPLKGDYRRGVD